MSYSTKEINEHHRQSTHRRSTGDSRKRACLPLVMMEQSIRRFIDNNKGEKLAKAARVAPGVMRVRKLNS